MPNWCRNELKFRFWDFKKDAVPEAVRVEQLLDFLKETNENFADRLEDIKLYDKEWKTNTYYTGVHERTPFDFNNLIPYPEKFKQMDRDFKILTKEEYTKKYPEAFVDFTGRKTAHPVDGFNFGGYDWCAKNWGTKWNANAPVYLPQYRTMMFETAWAPPMPVIRELHRRFPDGQFYFEWYERGMGIMGGCQFIPEADWYPEDISSYDTWLIEKALKKGEPMPELKWEAGKPYHEWETVYGGFKGG